MPFKVKNQRLGSGEASDADEETSDEVVADVRTMKKQAGPAEGVQSRPASLPFQRSAVQQVQIKLLPINEVDSDPTNPRGGNPPQIEKLAASIRRNGLLQPIGVVASEGEHYICKFGNRRLAAYKRLAQDPTLTEQERTRFQNIPTVTISSGNGEEEAILSNTQIVALSAEDKARAFQLLHGIGYNDSDIGELFNLRRQTVNSYRNNREQLASGMTIYEVQHPGKRRGSAATVSDNRTGRGAATYWAASLIERAVKNKLEPPRNDEQKSQLLQLRNLIDDLLGEIG